MTRRWTTVAGIAGVVACLAGCGSTPMLMLPTPTPPAASAYLGSWAGTLTDQAAGTGAITIVFSQGVASAAGGVNVSGTFNIQRQDGNAVVLICLNGSVFGSDVQQVFSLSCSTENGTVTLALNDARDQASGTYAFTGAPFVKGSIQLEKH